MASGYGAVAVPMRDAGDDDDDNGPTLHIEATDVIKVVLQYLRESGLSNAADALRAESGVSLNAVPSVEAFRDDVAAGRWSDVLPLASAMRLPRRKLEALYEQVALELCEAGEGDTARALLNGSAVLRGMRDRERGDGKKKKKTNGFRYARLESAVFAATSSSSSSSSSSKGVDPALLWGGGVTSGASPRALRDARRAALADSLASEVVAPPPGRLLTLLGQALRYHHQSQSSSSSPSPSSKKLPRLVFGPYDLLLGVAGKGASAGNPSSSSSSLSEATMIADAPPSASRPLKLLKFGARSHPEAAAFSPDGTTLATGSADGFIELWHAKDDNGENRTKNLVVGTLREDLAFQKEENFMSHGSAVLSLAWSADSAMLASGDKKGCIKVWRASTGLCLRRMEGAHSAGVTALAFAPPGGSGAPSEEKAAATATTKGDGPSSSSSSSSAHLLSASYDGTARVHGLRSGRVLKELAGHGSYVTCAAWATGAVRAFGSSSSSASAAPPSAAASSASSRLLFGGKRAIVTGSADGAVRYWDASTGECLSTVVPPAIHGASPSAKDDEDGGTGGGGAASASASASPPAVVSVLPHPRRPGLFVAATRSPGIHLLSFAPPEESERGASSSQKGNDDDDVVLGATLRSVPTGKGRGKAGGDAVALCLSKPAGKWAMVLAEDGCLYCFSLPVEVAAAGAATARAGSDSEDDDDDDDEDDDDDDEDDDGVGGAKKKKNQKKKRHQAQQRQQKTDAEFAAAVTLERVVPVVVVDRSSAGSSSSSSAVDKAAAEAAAASLQKAIEGGSKPPASAAAPSLAKKHAPAASLASVPIGVCCHPWSQVTATWSADGELRLWEGERVGDDDDDDDDDDEE